MREKAFREALEARIGARSVASYVAYCRRVERELGLDLDACDLTTVGLASLERTLRAAGVPGKSLNNCLSAVRAYAAIDQMTAPGLAASPPMKATPPPRRMAITPEQRQAWAANTADGPFNRWLDTRIRNADGQLDLERLHALAREYGIDKREAYADLNAGQQRMNIGNQLRTRVPRELFELEPSPAPATPEPIPPSEPTAEALPPAEAPTARPSIRESSTGGLLALYGEILDELRRREVVRTGNSPVGDYAELLFARAFGWTLEPNSSAGHDATDEQGVRYQIKGRRVATATGSRQLGSIRRLHAKTFDMLAAVLLDPSFKVTRAILIPHEIVVQRARRSDHTNGWSFTLDDKVWREPGVWDVAADLAVAASRL